MEWCLRDFNALNILTQDYKKQDYYLNRGLVDTKGSQISSKFSQGMILETKIVL